MNKMRLILSIPLAVIVIAVVAFFWMNSHPGAVIPPTDGLHSPQNSVYYWRTVYDPSDGEKDFISRNGVGRMYLRMFDVTADNGAVRPEATVQFAAKPLKGVEIVPTVFITVDALRQTDNIDALASRIVERVRRICQWNGVGEWHELQLDCDWTTTTRDRFYQLCRMVKGRLGHKLLSSTIRLHQLRQSAPPVDYGVLMVYNTDDFTNPHATNSILNDSTVEKYVSQPLRFRLPLDIALPIYRWNLIYSKNGKFKRIAAEGDWGNDSTETAKYESVPYEVLTRTQHILNEYLHLDAARHSTVLYHLDDNNINNYSHEEFESLYRN